VYIYCIEKYTIQYEVTMTFMATEFVQRIYVYYKCL